jgi:topoisomerase-4 subunit B
MEENNELINNSAVEYTDDNIRHLSDMEHVRTRPGMYIGKLGDGAHAEDGIYVLLKEVLDNSIDEFKMQAGKKIEITIEDKLRVSVRDFGRGIPQGKLIEAVSVLNTGGKYDSKAFKKSVGLNGVGVKAVNALSSRFEVRSYREGKVRIVTFAKGDLLTDRTEDTSERTVLISSLNRIILYLKIIVSALNLWKRCCAIILTSIRDWLSFITDSVYCRATDWWIC